MITGATAARKLLVKAATGADRLPACLPPFHSAQHGMIGFSGVKPMDNRDWMMQLPFVLINAAMAGLLGAAFNSLRMWLWKLRASKTQHCLRIGEVRTGLGPGGHAACICEATDAHIQLAARLPCPWRSDHHPLCAPAIPVHRCIPHGCPKASAPATVGQLTTTWM